MTENEQIVIYNNVANKITNILNEELKKFPNLCHFESSFNISIRLVSNVILTINKVAEKPILNFISQFTDALLDATTIAVP